MSEPTPDIRLTPKPVEPLTDTARLQALLKPEIWAKQGNEMGRRLEQQKRDALLCVQNPEGKNIQFIIVVDTEGRSVQVQILPTTESLRLYPELNNTSFSTTIPFGQDAVREALWGAVQKMELQNYRVDDALINLFDTKDK